MNQEANFADHLAPAIGGAVVEVWKFRRERGREQGGGGREVGSKEEEGYGIAK